MIEQLIEEIDNQIPLKLKQQLQLKSYREALFEKYGSDAFLDPKNLKYPIYEIENGINAHLVYGSYLRAQQNAEFKLAEKAKQVFQNNDKCNELSVKVTEKEELDLIDFTQLFTIEENIFLFDYIE